MSVYVQLIEWVSIENIISSVSEKIPENCHKFVIFTNNKSYLLQTEQIIYKDGIIKGIINSTYKFKYPEQDLICVYNHSSDKILDLHLYSKNNKKYLKVVCDSGIILKDLPIKTDIPDNIYPIELQGDIEWITYHQKK